MTRTEVLEMLNEETNPLIRQRLQDLLQRIDSAEKEEKPLLEALKGVGISVKSVWDLVNNQSHPNLKNNFIGSYEVAYPLLLDYLEYPYHSRVKEGIVRALTEKTASKIAKDKILKLFYKEEDKSLRWAMANALKTLMNWQQRQKYPEIKQVLDGQE